MYTMCTGGTRTPVAPRGSYASRNSPTVQGRLAQKKTPSPWDQYWALGVSLLKGLRENRFSMSEVPL